MTHPALEEELRKQPDGQLLENAIVTCFPAPDSARRVVETWPSYVRTFSKKDNSQSILMDKSSLLVSYVFHNSDITAEVYNSIAPNAGWLDHDHGNTKLEEAACWFRVVAVLSRQSLGEEHKLFIRSFASSLAHFLALEGFDPDEICSLLAARSSEYRDYKYWMPEHGGDGAGTLLWEAGKNIEKATGMPMLPLFPAHFCHFFLQRFKKAMIQELLCGN